MKLQWSLVVIALALATDFVIAVPVPGKDDKWKKSSKAYRSNAERAPHDVTQTPGGTWRLDEDSQGRPAAAGEHGDHVMERQTANLALDDAGMRWSDLQPHQQGHLRDRFNSPRAMQLTAGRINTGKGGMNREVIAGRPVAPHGDVAGYTRASAPIGIGTAERMDAYMRSEGLPAPFRAAQVRVLRDSGILGPNSPTPMAPRYHNAGGPGPSSLAHMQSVSQTPIRRPRAQSVSTPERTPLQPFDSSNLGRLAPRPRERHSTFGQDFQPLPGPRLPHHRPPLTPSSRPLGFEDRGRSTTFGLGDRTERPRDHTRSPPRYDLFDSRRRSPSPRGGRSYLDSPTSSVLPSLRTDRYAGSGFGPSRIPSPTRSSPRLSHESRPPVTRVGRTPSLYSSPHTPSSRIHTGSGTPWAPAPPPRHRSYSQSAQDRIALPSLRADVLGTRPHSPPSLGFGERRTFRSGSVSRHPRPISPIDRGRSPSPIRSVSRRRVSVSRPRRRDSPERGFSRSPPPLSSRSQRRVSPDRGFPTLRRTGRLPTRNAPSPTFSSASSRSRSPSPPPKVTRRGRRPF